MKDILPQINQLQRDPSKVELSPYTGIWIAEKSDDNTSIQAIHVSVIGPFFMDFILNENTSTLGSGNAIGYAKRSGAGWRGWFSIACRGCCPGKSWWDKGIVQFDRSNKTMVTTVHTVKMDPDSCELTDRPDQVILRSRLLSKFRIADIAPGKKIHIVAAPAVGQNPAQYKAAMKLAWSYSGFGLKKVDVAARGPKGGKLLVNKGNQLTGEVEYVTTWAGKHSFLLIGYNPSGQPIHYETRSIDVPAIPGINSAN